MYNQKCSNYPVLQMTILLIFLHLQCSALVQRRAMNPETQKKIDDFIENVYLPGSQISGMSLAIVQNDGEVLYTTAYGLADKENDIENNNSTQFLVGSVTKSFTSMLVAKLLQENFPTLGEAVLDTPIRKLLPQANFTLIDRFRSEHATFRDLLAHRLCLLREDLPLMADPFQSVGEVTFRTRYNKENCGVREKFDYNNQIYVVAGELAGILANKSFEDAMQDLLNQIGMTNTSFVQMADNFTQMPFRALPYYIKDNVTHPMNTDLVKRVKFYNAAGGLFTTPDDMAKYMGVHLSLGNMGGRQIIPKEVMNWLTKLSSMGSGFSFKKSDSPEDLIVNEFLGYGLGLTLSSYDGWSLVQHGGYFPPYTSLMSLYPDKKLGIFTSTNMGPVKISPDVLHAFIFETLRGSSSAMEKTMKFQERLRNDEEINKNITKRAFQTFYQDMSKKAVWQNDSVDIIGVYGSGSAGDVEISEKFNEKVNKAEYYLKYGKWYKGWLQEEVRGVIFKLIYDTDLVQDDYADGRREGSAFAAFENNALIFFTPAETEKLYRGRFERNVTLDSLPPVPWNSDSCG